MAARFGFLGPSARRIGALAASEKDRADHHRNEIKMFQRISLHKG